MYKLQLWNKYSKKWVDGTIKYTNIADIERAKRLLKRLHNIDSRILEVKK